MKRLFDIVVSGIGLILLSWLFLIIAICIVIDSRGGVFFRGPRVGQHGKTFRIFKFRSMKPDSEGKGKWNVGDDDDRITVIGHFLRKSKLDEIPQLINVFLGDMSFVGPRPELQVYVDMYTDEEKPILDLKPGITDYASMANFDQFENLIIAKGFQSADYLEDVAAAQKLDDTIAAVLKELFRLSFAYSNPYYQLSFRKYLELLQL